MILLTLVVVIQLILRAEWYLWYLLRMISLITNITNNTNKLVTS